ncbi:MAG: class I SAM-dependent methyltransferase [Methylophilaceae bacterium]
MNLLRCLSSLLTPPPAPSVPVRSAAVIRRLLEDSDGKNILDLGSGTRILKPHVVRLDITHHPNVSVQGDARRLPFADHSFDLVICSHVLEHVNGYWLAAEELRCVTRLGGVMLIEVPFIFPFHTGTPDDRHDYVRLTLDGLRAIVDRDQILEEGLAVGHGSMLMLILVEWVGRLFYIGHHSALYYLVRNTLSWLLYPLCWLDPWLDRRPRRDVIGGAYYLVARRSNGA